MGSGTSKKSNLNKEHKCDACFKVSLWKDKNDFHICEKGHKIHGYCLQFGKCPICDPKWVTNTEHRRRSLVHRQLLGIVGEEESNSEEESDTK